MIDVRFLISKLSGKHILKGAPDAYVDGFANAVSRVHAGTRIEKILRDKFFIPDDSNFELNKYLQNAAELSVQNHLNRCQRIQDFAVEKAVNPPKNVDLYYRIGGIHVSMEVKCPEEAEPLSDAYVVTIAGRIPEHLSRFNAIKSRIESRDASKLVVLTKNKDNTLRDFLVSAQEKFSAGSGVDNLNVLFIACGDCANLQEWYFYLYGNEGLFAKSSTCVPCEFNLVDVVLLSNLKYWHQYARECYDWTLHDVFLLPFVNPHGRPSVTRESILGGLGVLDHHLLRFARYLPASENEQLLKVIHYVAKELRTDERKRFFPRMQK